MKRAAHAAEERRDGTSEGELLAHVAMMAALQPGSVLELLLARGQSFPYAPRPAQIAKGEDKQCFYNAFVLARFSSGLHYCEGFATSIIPVLHAWCVTDEGVVVDPTWHEREYTPVYFGLVMDTARLTAHLLRQGTYGVLANWTGAQDDLIDLLRGEHNG